LPNCHAAARQNGSKLKAVTVNHGRTARNPSKQAKAETVLQFLLQYQAPNCTEIGEQLNRAARNPSERLIVGGRRA